jgi:tetratricopeptide (TPR) repeat protein
VAKGWHSRAGELIADERESREHGLWCWMGSRLAAAESEPEKALALATEAYELGRLSGDPVVESLGLIYRGFFELCLGETEKGLEDQNIAAALGLSSDIDPVVGSTIYCNILWACRNFADWARANHWSVNYERWCRSSGLDNLSGSCRLHRAEVLGINGTLAEARALVSAAIEQLKEDAPWAIGDALRVLGDIHFAAGELDDAESAYHRAYSVGWDPQPGFALLQLERGEGQAANQGLERSLLGRSWPALQRKGLMLATLAKVAAQTGRNERATEIINYLETQPGRWPMPSIRALTAEAKAALMIDRKQIGEAIRELETACNLWMSVDAVISCAEARLLLARLFTEQGDLASAQLELKAVATVADRVDSRRLDRRHAELEIAVAAARREASVQ